MSNQLAIFKQIEEMHQQVRDFVEKQYPEYQVIHISNSSETEYFSPLDSTSRILGRNMVEFRIDGINAEHTKELLCDVMLSSDGEMCIMSETKRGRRV
jgi:hypothetical protein